MAAVAYFERRINPANIDFGDRRIKERRNGRLALLIERRRLASQVRRFRREQLSVPVHLAIEGGDSSGSTRDISPEGVNLLSVKRLEPSTALSLQFLFGGNVAYMNLSAMVVYSEQDDSDGGSLYSTGIKFSGLREWEEKIIWSVIENLEKAADSKSEAFVSLTIKKDLLAREATFLPIRTPEKWVRPSANIRRSTVHASKITGWGAYLPPHQISSDDMTSIVKTESNRKRFGKSVEKLTGIRSRRYAASQSYPSDLAVAACEVALKNAGIEGKDVEAIIFCGVSRDIEEPAVANIIQERLGARYSYVFDLSNACNGFVSGVDVMDSFIATNRCETGLVVAGEVMSQYVTFNPSSKPDVGLSAMGYTLGDGAGAVVMQRKQKGEDSGIRARWFLADGNYWKVAVIPLMDGKGRHYFKSNGAEIERVAIKYVPGGVEETMEMLGWSINDVDLVIPHQVSSHIIDNLFFKSLKFPVEKVYWSFPEHGNLGAASMPVAMYNALSEGRAKSGDKVLLVGGSGGFGVGIIGLVL